IEAQRWLGVPPARPEHEFRVVEAAVDTADRGGQVEAAGGERERDGGTEAVPDEHASAQVQHVEQGSRVADEVVELVSAGRGAGSAVTAVVPPDHPPSR